MSETFRLFERKLKDDNASPLSIESFNRSYSHLLSKAPGTISSSGFAEIESLPSLDALGSYEEAGIVAMRHVVIVKLNGGLGTSMGLESAKSLIEVREGLSFLDIIVRQVLHLNRTRGVAIPLVFMNSYQTQTETLRALDAYQDFQSDIPRVFLQHRIPKVDASTYEPVVWPGNPALEWCPPGHGDIYLALQTSGMLDLLLQAGKEYAFISNSDNLGAVFDACILGYMNMHRVPFIMEVTERTVADRKGGHLARLLDGTLILREFAQCPTDELDAFQNIGHFRSFNTNNLWIHLPSLKALIERHHGVLPLPIIRNRKTVDPTDPSSTPVYQLETAMGSAIALFDHAQAVHVPRTRFAPVKTTDDLLALWSDAYELTNEYHVRLHPDRKGNPVDVSLDRVHYGFLRHLRERFPHGAPSLLRCSSLRIEGDILFGSSVVCIGNTNLRGSGYVPDEAILSGIIHLGDT